MEDDLTYAYDEAAANEEQSLLINVTTLPDSSIHVETNYDILAVFMNDNSDNEIDIESFFNIATNLNDASENASEIEDRPDITDIVPNPTNMESLLMQNLLSQMRARYGGNTEEECFPTNPSVDENYNNAEFEDPHQLNRSGSVDWCSCGNCLAMPTDLESICCKEMPNAAPYLSDHSCLTCHESFRALCLRDDFVNTIMRTLGEVLRPPAEKEKNRLLRKTAYRTFTAWVHGYLGMGNRRPIPACVVNKVRGSFPDPDGDYMGFKSAIDEIAEFMAFEQE